MTNITTPCGGRYAQEVFIFHTVLPALWLVVAETQVSGMKRGEQVQSISELVWCVGVCVIKDISRLYLSTSLLYGVLGYIHNLEVGSRLSVPFASLGNAAG